MYQPRHFKMTDTARMHELVQRYPLSLMMVVVEGEVQANPVPVLLDPGARDLAATMRALAD